MQGQNLPPQYHLPASAFSKAATGAAVAAGQYAAASLSRSRSPSPSADHPGNSGYFPSRDGYDGRVNLDTPPPVPPKGSSTGSAPGRLPVPPSHVYGSKRAQGNISPARSPLPTLATSSTGAASPNGVLASPGPQVTTRDNADSRPSSSASSMGGAEEMMSSSCPSPSLAGSTSSYRIPGTPRKRKVLKGVNARSPRSAAYSPRRERRDREKQRSPPESSRHPTIMNTLSYLLWPIRLLMAPLRSFMSPIFVHIFNAMLLVGLLLLVLYIATSRLKSLLSSFPLVTGTALLPLRTLATPSCLLLNVMCPLSLLSSDNSTARPIWQLFSGSGSSVDVAAVSRSLSSEVRVASDIFDSLLSLGDGRMMEGLAHVRIHELGIAIQTGSNLDERFFIGQELVELADTASSMADEIVKINAMSVSIFSWLFWEFSHVVKLLDRPDTSRPSPATLATRLDSLVARLDSDLDRLYQRVGAAIPVAAQGAQQGWALHERLSEIHADLRTERERYPKWQRAVEAGKHFFAGGDPSKLTRISRDLDITRNTIEGITETRNSLEHVRIGLVAFRDQVRHFSGSVMGLHLGADPAIGLGPEEELAILNSVVGELGSSVGRAKRKPVGDTSPRLGIDAD